MSEAQSKVQRKENLPVRGSMSVELNMRGQTWPRQLKDGFPIGGHLGGPGVYLVGVKCSAPDLAPRQLLRKPKNGISATKLDMVRSLRLERWSK